MKIIHYLILFLLFSLGLHKDIAAQQIGGSIYQPISQIEDGNYKAIVKYYNPSTLTASTYELVVTIKNDRVIGIHFPNEGSLHSGYNNSGYTYSGGDLQFKYSTNSSGQTYITSAKTIVNVRYRNGSQTSYTIIL